jgi:predicted enzyme related to lactoylglutathione lyase
LYTPNAKRAREFYMALLNAAGDPMEGGLEYYVLKHGEEMLGGVMQIDPSWGNLPAQWVPYFSVANTDATAAVVVQHGGQVMGPIDDSPFGRLAALKDPGGATFKIIQPPAA